MYKINCKTTLLLLTIILSSIWGAKQPWSTSPPGDLPVEQVPQFVVIGFDDNSSTEAMNWILDFMKELKNPDGSGNAATFDALPVRTSFYTNGQYLDGDASLRTVHLRAYNEGHEIGNHTYSHPHGATVNAVDGWVLEMKKCTESIVNSGIPESSISGFRTPYLEYNNNTFPAVKQSGLKYDCSIEDGYSLPLTGYPWPYTLDDGAWQVDPVAGLWILPNCPLDKSDGSGKVTGFDYNMWVAGSAGGAAMDKEAFLSTLKNGLDQRLASNRSPFMFGAHTQYYVDAFSSSAPNATTEERREAIEEFIAYALTKEDVRFVTAKQILQWCENPVPLGVSPDSVSLHIITLDGKVTTSPSGTLFEIGSEVTLTATPNVGYEFSHWSGDLADEANPVTITLQENKTITANFVPIEDTTMMNLVPEFGWSVGVDTTIFEGGSICTASLDTSGDVVSATLLRAHRVDTTKPWPWASLNGTEGVPFTNATQIKISYSADKPLLLSLPQETLMEAGTNWSVVLPKGDTTLLLPLNESVFSQPTWVTEKTPLDLSKIEGVNFEISADDYSMEQTLNLTISYLGIGNYNGNTAIFSPKPLMQDNLILDLSNTQNGFTFNSPCGQNISYKIVSLQGKLIASNSIMLHKGFNHILVGPLASGMYILKIHNINTRSSTLFRW